MSREWKPGDVAMVTWTVKGEERTDLRFRRYRSGLASWVWESPEGTWIGDATAKKVRPLVVIDPESVEDVNRMIDLLLAHGYRFSDHSEGGDVDLQAALREYANPKPPKPGEPTGLGAVVEDVEGERWVLIHGPSLPQEHWYCGGRNARRMYAGIEAARVLSEGIS